MSLGCSVDTPHKRALLEALNEEAVETELSIPLYYRSKLACARCNDAFRFLGRSKWIYPKYKWNSWLHTVRLTMKYRIVSRFMDAWDIVVGRVEFTPGRDYPTRKRATDAEELQRRRDYNLAVKHIAERNSK